ncbi:MAG: hypothetical protein M1838_001485 [Thelocarpon superellum]|nr:MAG: hypothetical protein M1838_001485 [Thelocarpon superellum]
MTIAALPTTAIRALGSAQVLTGPAAVVKELLDNAYDAHASAIVVEISANTLDLIQVRDNGHGIAPDDRDLIGQRHHTSKLRDLTELRQLGGQTLGFRGEALASAAALADAVTVTTRQESDVVACKMSLAGSNALPRRETASHPVGTTVRIVQFFAGYPVRREAALKSAATTIAHVKQTLHAYVLARPTVRLSFKIVKATMPTSLWAYVPGRDAGVGDAVRMVIGAEAYAQCSRFTHDWPHPGQEEHHSTPGGRSFRLDAVLPIPTAAASKIHHKRAFLAIDGRPVASRRGPLHQIVSLYKRHVRSALSKQAAATLTDPFMYLHLSCPPGSYDANVEPAKDDVLFADAPLILAEVETLFRSVYGALPVASSDPCPSTLSVHAAPSPFDLLMATRRPVVQRIDVPRRLDDEHIDHLSTDRTPKANACRDIPLIRSDLHSHGPGDDFASGRAGEMRSPRQGWRTEMYAGDDEPETPPTTADRDHLDSNDLSDAESDVALRDIHVSNPWIKAKMNACMRPRAARQVARSTASHDDVRPALDVSSPPSAAPRLSIPRPSDESEDALDAPIRGGSMMDDWVSRPDSTPLAAPVNDPRSDPGDHACRTRDFATARLLPLDVTDVFPPLSISTNGSGVARPLSAPPASLGRPPLPSAWAAPTSRGAGWVGTSSRSRDIRDLIAAHAPLDFESDAGDSIDDSSTVQGSQGPATTHPDVAELLDYERRKQAANLARRSSKPFRRQPGSSPYHHRYQAAVAAISSPRHIARATGATGALVDDVTGLPLEATWADLKMQQVRITMTTDLETLAPLPLAAMGLGGDVRDDLPRVESSPSPMSLSRLRQRLHNLVHHTFRPADGAMPVMTISLDDVAALDE